MRVPQRKRIFIGCEGSSEQSYVKLLKILSDLQERHLHFESFNAQGGDPLAIIEKSIAAMKKKEALTGVFPHKAIFLDADCRGKNLERDQKAATLSARHGVVLLWQDCDFEAFVLRHLEGHEMTNVPVGHSLKMLKRQWPDYRKPADAKWLSDRIAFEDVSRMAAANIEFGEFYSLIGLLR